MVLQTADNPAEMAATSSCVMVVMVMNEVRGAKVSS